MTRSSHIVLCKVTGGAPTSPKQQSGRRHARNGRGIVAHVQKFVPSVDLHRPIRTGPTPHRWQPPAVGALIPDAAPSRVPARQGCSGPAGPTFPRTPHRRPNLLRGGRGASRGLALGRASSRRAVLFSRSRSLSAPLGALMRVGSPTAGEAAIAWGLLNFSLNARLLGGDLRGEGTESDPIVGVFTHGPNHEAIDVPNPRILFTSAGKEDARRC